MVATNFSLSALTEEHRNLLLVLAVAGDWSTAVELEELERLSTARGFVPPGRSHKFWNHLLKDWAGVGLVEQRDAYHAATYLLNRALAHEVLCQADPIILGRLHDALGSQAWHEGSRLSQSARVSLYIGDTARFISTMSLASREDWGRLFGADPHPNVFELVPSLLREQYLIHLAESALQMQVVMPAVVWSFNSRALEPYRLAIRALRGELTLESDLLLGLEPSEDGTGTLYAALAIVSLCSGRVDAAQSHGAKALALSTERQHHPRLRGAFGTWAALCALSGTPEQVAMGALLVSGAGTRQVAELSVSEELLEAFVRWQKEGQEGPSREVPGDSFQVDWSPLTWLVRAALTRWGVLYDCHSPEEHAEDADEPRPDDPRPKVLAGLGELGLAWASEQLSGLIEEDECTLGAMYVPKERWERRLDRLSGLVARLDLDAGRRTEPEEQRLVWVIREADEGMSIEARVQRLTRKKFTKGRKTVASTLIRNRYDSWVDDHDRAIIQVAERVAGRYPTEPEYEFGAASLLELAGHPRVFWETPYGPATVAREEPSIRVTRGEEVLEVCPKPWRLKPGPWAERDGGRLTVYDVDARHVQLCQAIGGPEGELPLEAEPRLAEILGGLAKNISMHSDIAPDGAEISVAEPNSALVLKLRRDADILQIRVMVRPFGEAGPVFEAGRGSAVVVTTVNGVATQTTRDLEEEVRSEAALFEACPSLFQAETNEGGDYTMRGLGYCLELIEELHRLGDDVTCLWSEGEALRFDLAADLDGLRVRFGEAQAWLSADIQIEVSEGLTLSAHDLVSRMVDGAMKYVRLDDGRFVALSEELAQKLSEITTLGALRKDGVALAPSNAIALGAWLSDLSDHGGVKGAKLANERLAQIQEAAELQVAVPSNFTADLRTYQEEAFHWLMRLAHWGGGALLCDDMGLGKTVQMLAVLTARGTLGPALVVAPVSVSPHWVQLMAEFAPDLRPKELEATGRAEAFAALGPMDVLVVSYGLLHSEVELLSSRVFSTIVLDEAQAIKNARSLRARAAHRLKGDFRVVTTGTPIENHLGELWSIMTFANPGLLGTAREFAEAFGKPIQKDGSKQAGDRLRRILRPFLLRRTKGQVLHELPPKTEITLEIEPSEAEAAYYAAVRDAMLAEIQAGRMKPSHQRMQVLAALMKLRRIACHPRLADDTLECGSAKQDAFIELASELREAGHRLLVFSQFVGHLDIARKNLESRGISYQYLDGQTSKAQRRNAVTSFQAGEGDVFLISLRAGGVGLNLTGADYVIHLDPWWNPAVEDQASDRAHRIGQERPVTVYRLVTKGTVEEKVLELHGRKRQLAEDLISGSETAGALGVDDLVALMRDVDAS